MIAATSMCRRHSIFPTSYFHIIVNFSHGLNLIFHINWWWFQVILLDWWKPSSRGPSQGSPEGRHACLWVFVPWPPSQQEGRLYSHHLCSSGKAVCMQWWGATRSSVSFPTALSFSLWESRLLWRRGDGRWSFRAQRDGHPFTQNITMCCGRGQRSEGITLSLFCLRRKQPTSPPLIILGKS